MKKPIFLLGGLVLLLSLAAACGQNLQPRVEELEKEVAVLEDLTGPPPEFLDRLYPPQAPAPIYLIEMMARDRAFNGLFADLFEQDFANVPGDLEAFKAQYHKMRNEVVPGVERPLSTGTDNRSGRGHYQPGPGQDYAGGRKLGRRSVCQMSRRQYG